MHLYNAKEQMRCVKVDLKEYNVWFYAIVCYL